MKTNRIKHTAPVLRSRTDVESTLNEIVGATINRNKAQLDMDAEIAAVRERYEGNIGACNKAIEQKTELLRAWAEAHPEEFTGARGLPVKSLDFLQATIGFRTGTPKLKTLSGWTWDRVLEKLKQLPDMWQHIRKTEEVNKQTLLTHRDPLELGKIGLRVLQEESFFVDPKLTDQENRIDQPIDHVRTETVSS